jgi:PKD repeat protein
MKRNLFIYFLVVLIPLIGLSSCEEETPAPTVTFTFEVDGSDVTFTSTATDTDSYLWDFGDGSSSTDADPVHSYVVSGTYTVTLTVTGGGGEATFSDDVEILPSFDEMLTGGPTATNGKTWVLSPSYTEGVDGGSAVEPSMTILLAGAENLLTGIGFPEEYNDEFTFKSDGTYTVDNKNGASLANLMWSLYGGVAGEIVQTDAANEIGLCTKAYASPITSTWTLHEDDLVVTAAPYGGEDVPAASYDVTFSGETWIEVSGDAYFAILDNPATRKYIITEITPDLMRVAVFICAYWADPLTSLDYPTLMFHLTLEPK